MVGKWVKSSTVMVCFRSWAAVANSLTANATRLWIETGSRCRVSTLVSIIEMSIISSMITRRRSVPLAIPAVMALSWSLSPTSSFSLRRMLV